MRQQQGPREDEEFRGLYVSAEEVDALLDRALAPAVLLLPQVADSDQLTALDAALTALAA